VQRKETLNSDDKQQEEIYEDDDRDGLWDGELPFDPDEESR
jgi:hypothetical protein